MGTRCLMMIFDERSHILLYRHNDGKPEDRFPKILQFNQNYGGRVTFLSCGRVAASFVMKDDWQPISYIPWDVEFIYIVDISKETWDIHIKELNTLKLAYENNQAYLKKITSNHNLER